MEVSSRKPILISKRNIGWAIFALISGIAFVAGSVLLIYNELNTEHTELANLVFGIVCLPLAIIMFTGFVGYLERYVLYSDKLEIWSFRGHLKKTIHFEDITGWNEASMTYRYGSYNMLTLFTSSSKTRISSLQNDSYYPIKFYATQGKPLKETRKK